MPKKITIISWAVRLMKAINLYKFKVLAHETTKAILQSEKKILFIIDHADLYPILLFFLMSNKKIVPFNKCITIISGSEDGDIAKYFLEKKDITCITKDKSPRISSSNREYGNKIKERFRTIRQFIKEFKKARYAMMVINEKTPSGLPRITRSSWFFAKNVECQIVPVCSLSKAEIILNSNWDFARIPTPLSTINFMLGEPIPFSAFDNCVSKNCESEIIHSQISTLRRKFIAIMQKKEAPEYYPEL